MTSKQLIIVLAIMMIIIIAGTAGCTATKTHTITIDEGETITKEQLDLEIKQKLLESIF